MIHQQIKNLLKMTNLSFSDAQVRVLERFLLDVELLGSPLGLTQAKGEELLIEHLMDSLAPYMYMTKLSLTSLADVGSGAGFPGLVLAIVMPEVTITLIERMQKRARFLEMMVAKLQLTNVHVVHGDVKNVDKRFDAITFRALTQMDCALATLLLKKSPLLLAYKGRLTTVMEEIKVLTSCGYLCEVEPLELPYREKERNLLIIREKNKD